MPRVVFCFNVTTLYVYESRGKKTVRRFKYKTQVKRGYLKASKRRDLKASKHKVKTVRKNYENYFLQQKADYLFNKVVFMYNIETYYQTNINELKKDVMLLG